MVSGWWVVGRQAGLTTRIHKLVAHYPVRRHIITPLPSHLYPALVYFPLNSESEGTTSDSTGNGNTGTFRGSSSVSTGSYRYGKGSALFSTSDGLVVSSFETTSSAGTVSNCAQSRAVS